MGAPVVEISDGKLKGKFRKNYKGEEIFAFLGVPYAKPPVGELRFKAPLLGESWTGVKDATQDGNKCYQRDLLSHSYGGSEDCLYLNVFTKKISENQPLQPVLVFIHGGAFIMGSNNSSLYSPGFLMMEDIVLVTINYRLGILGFMKLNDPALGIPGNAGLKDQVLALKWIQKNIEKFGGDPNNVTIYGESAGAASVNFHVLSPSSKGLFHKAIMQSGSVLNPWPHIRPNYLEVMKFINSDCKNESEILKTLMNTPVHDLVEAQMKFSEEQVDDKLRLFGPCVEAPNETAFLTRNPIEIITSGEYNKVPMIIGYNSNEGLITLMGRISKDYPIPEIKYDQFVPHQMNLPPESAVRKEICEKLKKVYSNDRSSDRISIVGDFSFVSGIIGLLENLANTCPEPIFYHKLSLCSSLNGFRIMTKTEEPGACHADDLFYFFDSEMPMIPKGPLVPGSIEEKAVKRYVRLWGNFLKYGNPTPDEKEFGLTWKPITKDNLYCLDVDKELSLKVNPEGERMKLWRTIYKLNENTKNFMP